MKVKTLILLIVALFIFSEAVFASDEKSPVSTPSPTLEETSEPQAFSPDDNLPPPPPFAFSKEEARLLKSLFLMSDVELRRLRGFIQRLEKTSPEQRKKMAADLNRASSDMTQEQRRACMKEMRERFRKSQENLLARYYSTLSKEQANIERKKFLALDHKGRRAYLFDVRKKLGYVAPQSTPEENEPRRAFPPPKRQKERE